MDLFLALQETENPALPVTSDGNDEWGPEVEDDTDNIISEFDIVFASDEEME